MLSLISPAKSLDYSSDLPSKDHSLAELLDDSKVLIKELQKKDPNELASLMGISEKLANLNFERNMNWSEPKELSPQTRQAIFAFKGNVYLGLDIKSLKPKSLSFAQSHLRILSGLYGVLRPLDLMEPYRLEMGTKLKNPKGKDLYEFWGDKITKNLNKSLEEHTNKTALNLASVEYFSSVKTALLKGPVITPVFKDFKNGQYKIISFFAKKARGLMVRFILDNYLDNPQDIKQFNLGGYKFSKKDSKEFSPVFLRKAS